MRKITVKELVATRCKSPDLLPQPQDIYEFCQNGFLWKKESMSEKKQQKRKHRIGFMAVIDEPNKEDNRRLILSHFIL